MDFTNISIDEKSKNEVLPSIAHFANMTTWITLDDVQLLCSLKDYMVRDPFPIPVKDDRELYYEDRHYDYWLSGLKDYLRIQQVLTKQGITKEELSTFFELGCAS